MPNTFCTPVWLKREALGLAFESAGHPRSVVDAIPDDELDEFAHEFAVAMGYGVELEDEDE